MKKLHIVLLVLIAGVIAALISLMQGFSTFETIASAKSSPNKYFQVAARIDTSQKVHYDELKDPNFCKFTVVDEKGEKMNVVYRQAKIKDMEKSERLIMGGKYTGEYFECKEIQVKCPSKYKDDMNQAKKNIQQDASTNTSNNTTIQFQ
jgi:cytochrome c-type biogenesis protein CcmE